MTNAKQTWNRWKLTSLLRGSAALGAMMLAVMMLASLAGCDSAKGGVLAGGDSARSLSDLPWCDRPLISFQDDSNTSSAAITKWDAVKDQLGFTPYLPPTLPKGSCLALAGGSIHDPIFGGKLSITYVLPTSGPLAFSEAPKRQSAASDLQCVASGQKQDTTICQGVIGSTNVTMAARQTSDNLKALFQALQPNIDWVPKTTPGATPSPSPTR